MSPNPEDLVLLVSSCDLLVLPTTPDILALDALALMVDYLSQMQWVNYKILLTVIPPPPSQAGQAVRAMLQSVPLPLLAAGIRRYVAYQKAAQAGRVVYEVKDGKAELAWQDYLAAGQELLHP
jgi:chromosome partitioning protein